jgi:hypothetical protein
MRGCWMLKGVCSKKFEVRAASQASLGACKAAKLQSYNSVLWPNGLEVLRFCELARRKLA